MNPIIQTHFTADPTVLVYGDTAWLYTGHDEPPDGVDDYVMKDWLCFSSRDLQSWQEHPLRLKATDFKWASGDAYASRVIERNNKFYWYVAVSHASIPGKAIGVAISDHPAGPFTDAIGRALISGDMVPSTGNEKANLDPTVITDTTARHILCGAIKTVL
ncbi:family 43 glycosylhydrolase [Pedobacter sp.]|uniref:family 43 glycosylhydrolase n=1 Tax=Pedobacter sp. TaxID=1411316 RepID=UPI0039C9D843